MIDWNDPKNRHHPARDNRPVEGLMSIETSDRVLIWAGLLFVLSVLSLMLAVSA